MRLWSMTPQDRFDHPAQPTHPSWHLHSGLQAHDTRLDMLVGAGDMEARGSISLPSTVPWTLNDRAQRLNVEDLAIAQVFALMETCGIKAAQLAAVCSE